MQMNLLEMTQAVINAMDGDEITSITDTFEAEQVAIIIRDTYNFLTDNRNWPHLKMLVALTETDASSPTTLMLPTTMKELIDLRFDKREGAETRRKYRKLTYLHPDEFLDKTNLRNNDNSNVEIVQTPQFTEFMVYNDRHPSYWTSFSNESLTFDAYDSALYTYTPYTRVQCYGVVAPTTWNHIDTFTPDLPDEAFSLLLEEAKSTAFYYLKNMVNEKAESRSQKADTWLSRKAFTAKGGVRYPDYGRRPQSYVNRKPHPLMKDD